MPFQTQRAVRKPIYVDYVRVTPENMEELARWANGEIQKTRNGAKYIYIEVLNPQEPKQKKAMVGDYLLRSPNGFKIYTEYAFNKMFDPITSNKENPHG